MFLFSSLGISEIIKCYEESPPPPHTHTHTAAWYHTSRVAPDSSLWPQFQSEPCTWGISKPLTRPTVFGYKRITDKEKNVPEKTPVECSKDLVRPPTLPAGSNAMSTGSCQQPAASHKVLALILPVSISMETESFLKS
jgi:hypothetical protein